MKLIVFSVCKDEAATIGEVLDRIPNKIKHVSKIEKLVISDGSKDDTVKIARKKGAKVIEGFKQKRLAYRFEQAMEYVLTNDADVAVNIDGDLQFKPEDIPRLLAPIISGKADFVVADRFTDLVSGLKRKPTNMPVNKYWANRVGSFIVGMLSGEKFRDVTCGFRAYNRKAMYALNINTEYTYTQESFQVLALKKLDIVAVPVNVKYYKNRKSRVVTNFSHFLLNSAINIMRGFRDFAPLKFFFWLGGIPVFTGFLMITFVLINWINTSSFSPYKFLGFTGLYMFSLGVIIWVVGLVADMLNRVLKNQEKIISNQKKLFK